MPESILQNDAIIYHEMMAHLPLFTHHKPKTVALSGDLDQQIEQELRKHPTVTDVLQLSHEETMAPHSLDVLIVANPMMPIAFDRCFQLLHEHGILLQQSESPFQLTELKSLQQKLHATGFRDVQIILFPQPSFPSGWRSAVMAKKHGTFKRPREKDIFNKNFLTHYYNFDVHRAALALPEFMRRELAMETINE